MEFDALHMIDLLRQDQNHLNLNDNQAENVELKVNWVDSDNCMLCKKVFTILTRKVTY